MSAAALIAGGVLLRVYGIGVAAIVTDAFGICCLIAKEWVSFRSKERLTDLQRGITEAENEAKALREKQGETEDELQNLNFRYRIAFERYLQHLAGQSELDAKGRISAYHFDGKCLVLAARYSKMRGFDEGSQRKVYPTSHGVIGRAWSDGEARLVIPYDLAVAIDEYIQEQVDAGLDADTAKHLNMKSMSYFAIAVDDPNSEKRCGVVVVESLRPDGLDPDALSEDPSREKRAIGCLFMARGVKGRAQPLTGENHNG